MSTQDCEVTNNVDKYSVTLYCRAEAGCDQSKAPDGEPCVNCYCVYATSTAEAVDDAFHRHAMHCTGQPGLCEISVEVNRIEENLVD